MRHFTVTLFADNEQLVIQRIVIICSRKKIFIKNVDVCEIGDGKHARFTVLLRGGERAIEKVVKQFERIVEAHSVSFTEASLSEETSPKVREITIPNRNGIHLPPEKELGFEQRL